MSFPIRPPIVVHHSANLDGHHAPDNSLEAIRASLDAGAAVIELDIVALADSDYLLVHDLDLSSETTGQGLVAGCSVEQARGLRYRFDDSAQFHVPLLTDVVNLFCQHPASTRLQLDFKNTAPFPSDEPLRRLLRIIEPLSDRVIVSTGADWQLRRLRKLAPWLELGFDIHYYIDWRPYFVLPREEAFPTRVGIHGYYDDHPLASFTSLSARDYLADRCQTLVAQVPGVTTFYCSFVFLLRSLADGFNWAEALHQAGIACDAWTINITNTRAETYVRTLLEAGVDLFTTNTPRALSDVLERAAK